MTWTERRDLFVGAALGAALTLGIFYGYGQFQQPHTKEPEIRHVKRRKSIVDGVDGLVGNTPMVRIRSLSEATGCDILAKAEFLNPGGSAKDRVALHIIKTAEKSGLLTKHTHSTIFEGTVGSTGISIAMIARAKRYRAHIVMPDDQSQEKYQLLEKLGATVEKVRPVSIVDKKQFVNLARTRAEEFSKGITSGNKDIQAASDQNEADAAVMTTKDETIKPAGFFADQFENIANFEAHYQTTGPETYEQTEGRIDAIVLGAGTGGTIAGISSYLKPRIPALKVFLADPPGSGLYHKVKHNIMYAPQEAEGTRRRHQVDTVVEGIGINRLTRNFALGQAHVEDAFRVEDSEACKMARFLVREDGLFVGSSSAVNCVAAVRVARQLGPGHTIVTILNDSGQRHLTKFWNDEYLVKNKIDFQLREGETLEDFIV